MFVSNPETQGLNMQTMVVCGQDCLCPFTSGSECSKVTLIQDLSWSQNLLEDGQGVENISDGIIYII